MSPSHARILIYLLRRDLRLADNPIFHELARNAARHHITHLLPIYVFSPNQIETSGFLKAEASSSSSPFPPARSPIGQFWRTGPYRARFLAESLWDLKCDLERVQSTLVLRVGPPVDAIQRAIDEIEKEGDGEVVGVWMTAEEGSEEKKEERDVAKLLSRCQKLFKLWTDEKYFVDEYVPSL
jgi:deoxyribodipyrimidine photo-lyase